MERWSKILKCVEWRKNSFNPSFECESFHFRSILERSFRRQSDFRSFQTLSVSVPRPVETWNFDGHVSAPTACFVWGKPGIVVRPNSFGMGRLFEGATNFRDCPKHLCIGTKGFLLCTVHVDVRNWQARSVVVWPRVRSRRDRRGDKASRRCKGRFFRRIWPQSGRKRSSRIGR